MKRMLALLLSAVLVLGLTACGTKETDSSQPDTSKEEYQGPAISGKLAPEDLSENEISFWEDATDYDQGVVIRAETDVTDLRFFVLDYHPENDGPETEGEALYTCKELKKGEELVIVTHFPGDMPTRGVSVSRDGVREAYALFQSGKDGSLILDPLEA